jgi:hypothetical protein
VLTLALAFAVVNAKQVIFALSLLRLPLYNLAALQQSIALLAVVLLFLFLKIIIALRFRLQQHVAEVNLLVRLINSVLMALFLRLSIFHKIADNRQMVRSHLGSMMEQLVLHLARSSLLQLQATQV